MYVYVVTCVCDYEHGFTEIVGIFSTPERAEKCIEDLGGQQYWDYWDGKRYNKYIIEKWEVDEHD